MLVTSVYSVCSFYNYLHEEGFFFHYVQELIVVQKQEVAKVSSHNHKCSNTHNTHIYMYGVSWISNNFSICKIVCKED